MTAYVALLRGINVGKGNRVPMAELRTMLAELGYSKVATLLNSGNAVFCTPSAPITAAAKHIAPTLSSPSKANSQARVQTKTRRETQAGTLGDVHIDTPVSKQTTLQTEITAAIARKFGLELSVVVKSADEIAAVVQGNPYAKTATEHAQLFVVFAQDSGPLQGLSAIEPLVVPPEQFDIGQHAAYLHCAGGVLDSKAGAALLGKFGRHVTTRNWATTLKLHDLLLALAAKSS